MSFLYSVLGFIGAVYGAGFLVMFFKVFFDQMPGKSSWGGLFGNAVLTGLIWPIWFIFRWL